MATIERGWKLYEGSGIPLRIGGNDPVFVGLGNGGDRRAFGYAHMHPEDRSHCRTDHLWVPWLDGLPA